MQDLMTAEKQLLIKAFQGSCSILLLSIDAISNCCGKCSFRRSHVEFFPNDKLKNGFTTAKFKKVAQ